ncbi:hypothetical protein EEB18_012935 [Sphingopyxis sp. OPL5]|uniref:hypothetical protein n=1 Tax=Sphingopyxis sp. OPL5 TaxID=2486273 RepID=UPI00164E6F68|nr:hypothetical protein [Sphingopyxis sp. OPL5]QNO25699.1 hypothetical protein EEB18_012935 [Sphingopyxis sp. OPL5]
MQANPGVVAILLTPLLLLAACDGTDSRQTSAEERPTDEFARIEKLAFQSCMCKLAGHDSSGADRALGSATDSLETAGGPETPALPVHVSRTCYPKFGPDACLADFWVHEPYGDGAVCSYGQTDDLIAAAKDAHRASPRDDKRADAAVRKRFEAMRAEAAAKIPRSACN